MTRPILDVHKIGIRFGGLQALDHVSLQVQEQEIVALIGPNGAGKTTFFNCVTGVYAPDGGFVEVRDKKGAVKKIQGMKPNLITRSGLARTFQNIRLFGNMTALENVMVGRHCRTRSNFLGAVFNSQSFRAEERETLLKSYRLLEKVGIADFANQAAKNLPYAKQRILEIARALATEPSLLLLDEPAAGMNPQETNELDRLIVSIRDDLGISVLMIEHDMKLVMNISDKIFVMDQGRLIAQGKPEEIQNDPAVIKAYLGEDLDAAG